MNAAQVAEGIRADAFDNAALPPFLLRQAARVIADSFARRIDAVVASRPRLWRWVFRGALQFAVEVLRQVAEQVDRDYKETA